MDYRNFGFEIVYIKSGVMALSLFSFEDKIDNLKNYFNNKIQALEERIKRLENKSKETK